MKGTIYSNSTDYLGNYQLSNPKVYKNIGLNKQANNLATILGDDGRFYLFEIQDRHLARSIYVSIGDRVNFSTTIKNNTLLADNIKVILNPKTNRKENIIKKRKYLSKDFFLFYLTATWTIILFSMFYAMQHTNNKQIPTFLYTIISFIMTSIYSLIPRNKKTHLTDTLFNLVFPVTTISSSFFIYFLNHENAISSTFVLTAFILLIIGFLLKYLSDLKKLTKSLMIIGKK